MGQATVPEVQDPYRELFERSADAILIIEDGRFVDCNEATVALLRYQNKAALLRTHPSELSPAVQPDGRDSFEKANQMIALALANGSHRFEWDHVRADGEVFPVEVLLTAVQREGKQIIHVVWRDISERKLLETQLRHAQKMEAIGQLAGGIAHDFNNILVAILGNAELLAQQTQDRPDLLESVEEIAQAGERAARLVRQLLIFSRKQELTLRRLDLRQVLDDLVGLLRRLIGENLDFALLLPEPPVPVKADKSQLEQVVINLVANARDAMPKGGKLRVALDLEELRDTPPGARQSVGAGAYAAITVSDTGLGMDEATMARAFDPFFTTKSLGHGTGLGLATVYSIAQSSGGCVTLQSEPDRGTTVKVYLPLSQGVNATPSNIKPPPAQGGGETILVVEDDEGVSGLVVELLRRKGYRVLHAKDGMRALQIWEQESTRIDLILTDMVMPRMGGATLAAQLSLQKSPPRILFMSGHADQSIKNLSSRGIHVELLEKPFSPDDLIGSVRRAIDRPGPSTDRAIHEVLAKPLTEEPVRAQDSSAGEPEPARTAPGPEIR